MYNVWHQKVCVIIIEMNDDANDNNAAGNYRINIGKITTSRFFIF